jgi:hypothetical protein
MVPDPGANLALLGAQINLQNHELVGVRVKFGGFDSGNLQFNFTKIINGDHQDSF